MKMIFEQSVMPKIKKINVIKQGLWCLYHGYEYRISEIFNSQDDISRKIDNMKIWRNSVYEGYYKNISIEPGDVCLVSNDRESLKDGFFTYSEEKNYFVSIKIVHRNELSAAYKYDTHAVYDNIECHIAGGPIYDRHTKSYTDLYCIETNAEFKTDDRSQLLYEIKNRGFTLGRDDGRGNYSYIKKIKLDDPKLKIFEKRTEIDIDSL